MIIENGDALISSEIFTEFFVCDYASCAGECCVAGDSGAPLDEDEKIYIEKNIDQIIPYLKPEGIEVIKQQGVAVIDEDNDLVTPLIKNSEECAYSVYDEKGNCICGIERAYIDKKIDFWKPISCHLYPIRLSKIGDKIGLNYHRWSICQCARKKGVAAKVPVYQFLKAPIIRKFGEQFYEELEELDLLLKETNPI